MTPNNSGPICSPLLEEWLLTLVVLRKYAMHLIFPLLHWYLQGITYCALHALLVTHKFMMWLCFFPQGWIKFYLTNWRGEKENNNLSYAAIRQNFPPKVNTRNKFSLMSVFYAHWWKLLTHASILSQKAAQSSFTLPTHSTIQKRIQWIGHGSALFKGLAQL